MVPPVGAQETAVGGAYDALAPPLPDAEPCVSGQGNTLLSSRGLTSSTYRGMDASPSYEALLASVGVSMPSS